MHRRFSIAAAAVALLGLTASTAHAANPVPPDVAADNANDYVKSSPSKFHASSSDTFHQHAVITTKDGLQYVPYDRSYKGLKVLGGDFVVVTKPNGDVASTAVAQDEKINVSTTPKLSADQAAQTATQRATGTVDSVSPANLIVDATAGTPTLAYETVVTGHKGELIAYDVARRLRVAACSPRPAATPVGTRAKLLVFERHPASTRFRRERAPVVGQLTA